VTAVDLEAAKRVLENFDFVFVTDLMVDPRTHDLLMHTIGFKEELHKTASSAAGGGKGFVPPPLLPKNAADNDKHVGDKKMKKDLAYLVTHVSHDIERLC